MEDVLRIDWCTNPNRAAELADFFARNVAKTPAYISHSEMWGERALSPHQWRDGLPTIFTAEIEPRLHKSATEGIGPTSKPILTAEDSSGLLALSYVTFEGAAPVPYGIIEDIVVDPNRRGEKIGKDVVDWIVQQAKARDIHRLFLESGQTNDRAHHFFEHVGFEICSVVMLKTF